MINSDFLTMGTNTSIKYAYIKSTTIIFSSMQNGLSHTVDVLGTLTFSLAHVDVCYYLLPSRLHVQLRDLLLVNGFFA